MMFETRKILGDESIAINVTCARVPVRNCHSESVTLQTREPLGVERARELLEGMAGLVVDDPATTLPDGAELGRPRRRVRRPPAARPVARARLCMWVVSDNLLKGAATNAIQIAEVLHERGLVRVPTLRRKRRFSRPCKRGIYSRHKDFPGADWGTPKKRAKGARHGPSLLVKTALIRSLHSALALLLASAATASAKQPALWKVYNDSPAGSEVHRITHTIKPEISRSWSGFGPVRMFAPATSKIDGHTFTYAQDGFEATRYVLQTDQFGTQLDPPAHWAPEYAAIDECRRRSPSARWWSSRSCPRSRRTSTTR